MSAFTLNLTFTQADLTRFLASGSNVVVAKPNAGGDPNVAWIVFSPLTNNSLTWEEQYGIYASNVDITNGARLSQMSRSEFPAIDGKIYGIGAAGFFGPPESGGKSGSYTTTNQYDNAPKRYLTMGLFQNATVNGESISGNAISAAPVIYKSTAEITPYTKVYLWIQSQVKSNTVVTNVTSPMTEVKFGGAVKEINLAYDSDSGKFITPSSSSSSSAIPSPAPELKHILPML